MVKLFERLAVAWLVVMMVMMVVLVGAVFGPGLVVVLKERAAMVGPMNVADADNVTEKAASQETVHYYVVSAKELVGAYDENEVAADIKFKGQMVSVSGEVRSIGKDLMDQPYVSIRPGDQFAVRGVQCFFASTDAHRLARMRKGDTVTLMGKCGGLMVNVLLKDCQIVSAN